MNNIRTVNSTGGSTMGKRINKKFISRTARLRRVHSNIRQDEKAQEQLLLYNKLLDNEERSFSEAAKIINNRKANALKKYNSILK